jgi:drug/metabolite transporter (DMT)-like permease
VRAFLALVAVTAVWGVTFVQVKDAVALYPVAAFLAVRFAIASATLAPLAATRLPSLGRVGLRTGLAAGAALAVGYGLQTAGLDRTTVSSAGFITGLFVPLTPILALVLYRIRSPRSTWAGAAVATAGLALLSGVGVGDPLGDLLVLGAAASFALHIVLLDRYSRGHDPLALTLVQMLTAAVAFTLLALALGQLEMPHGWTVWGALVVTGVFASALGFLVQTWAQQRTTAARAALLIALEPVWTAFFGYVLAGDRLGLAGWAGAALIMAGIVLAEPAAAQALRRLVPQRSLAE